MRSTNLGKLRNPQSAIRNKTMARHFNYRSLEDLQKDVERLGVCVRLEPDRGRVQAALGAPRILRGWGGREWRVGNSLAVHPMEGCDGTTDGRPDALVYRRYQRFGRGGCKLLWFEATAVVPEGRANPRQLEINQSTAADLEKLLSAARAAHREVYGTDRDLISILQLTHSGRWSYPMPIIAVHNPVLDKPHARLITDAELEQLEQIYAERARLALEIGFDGIDLKMCHGYLMNELLAAQLRPGPYGGSLENRARVARNALARIRDAVGDRLLLCARLGAYDGLPYRVNPQTRLGEPRDYELPYRYGWSTSPDDPFREDLTETRQLIGWLRDWGVRLINITMGVPYFNPHVGRPFEKPDEGNYEPPEHPLLGVARHFRIAGALQRAFPGLPMVGTGYSWLQKYMIHAGAANLADGNIWFVGVGRGCLAYPDFARDALEKGELEEVRCCKTVTFCTYLMRAKEHPLGQFPTGCVPFDKEAYGPIMQEARRAKAAKK